FFLTNSITCSPDPLTRLCRHALLELRGPSMSQTLTLSPAQIGVLAMLASGATSRAAADASGVHRNTVSNWLNLPDFRDALAQAKYQTVLAIHEKAKELVTHAWRAIEMLVILPSTPASVRLKAALKILELASQPLPDAPAKLIQLPEEKLENPAQSCTPA